MITCEALFAPSALQAWELADDPQFSQVISCITPNVNVPHFSPWRLALHTYSLSFGSPQSQLKKIRLVNKDSSYSPSSTGFFRARPLDMVMEMMTLHGKGIWWDETFICEQAAQGRHNRST